MPRPDRSTVVYTCVCAGIALIAAGVWILATGQLRIPHPVVAVLAVGSAFLATGIERGARRRQLRRIRRARPSQTRHRREPV